MKKGFVYKVLYGKGTDEDFTTQNLPKNRAKQFFYAYKTSFGKITNLNMLAALFALPLLVWDLLASAYVADFMKGLDVKTQFSYLLKMSLLQYGTEIPLIMLAFVGLAGAYYVIRKICWKAPVRLIKDFNAGIKASYKQFLPLGLITGIANFIVNYLIQFNLLTISNENEFVYVAAIVGVILAAVIGFAALVFAMTQSSLYNLSFGKLIKNSFILTFKRLFSGIGVMLLSVLPIAVFRFMPWVFVQIIGGCLTMVFSIGFAITMQTVFCLGVFDVFINKQSYPDFVGLGLSSGKSYFQVLCDTTELDDDEQIGEQQTDTQEESGNENRG